MRWYQPKFRSPLYPWIQIVGIVVCLVLLFFIGMLWLATAGVIVIGGVDAIYGKQRAGERSGVAQRLGAREVSGLAGRQRLPGNTSPR